MDSSGILIVFNLWPRFLVAVKTTIANPAAVNPSNFQEVVAGSSSNANDTGAPPTAFCARCLGAYVPSDNRPAMVRGSISVWLNTRAEAD
jgi:hypothetical protein